MDSISPWSETKTATQEIRDICVQEKGKAENYLKKCSPFLVFEAEFYRDQESAGTNYTVKVYVGENEYAHMHVKKNPEEAVEFLECLFPKTLEDPLETF